MTKENNINGTTVSFPVRVSVKDLKSMVEDNAILSELSGKKSQNAVLFSSKPDGTAPIPASPKPGKTKQ